MLIVCELVDVRTLNDLDYHQLTHTHIHAHLAILDIFLLLPVTYHDVLSAEMNNVVEGH